jgi:hypothetical protein
MSQEQCGCWYTLSEGRDCLHVKQEKMFQLAEIAKENSSDALQVLSFIAAGFMNGSIRFTSGMGQVKAAVDTPNNLVAWEGTISDWANALESAFEKNHIP